MVSMYIVQRRDSENSQWHTCIYKGRKCRFDDLPRARIAFRRQKETTDFEKCPGRQFRILDSETNEEVK